MNIKIIALTTILLCLVPPIANASSNNFLTQHPYPEAPSTVMDKLTMEGVDNDNNGMRDVIDREIIAIVNSHCSSETEKENAYRKLFHIFKMMKPTNKVIDAWEIKSSWLKLPCKIGTGGYSSFLNMFKITVDTDERLDLAEAHTIRVKNRAN